MFIGYRTCQIIERAMSGAIEEVVYLVRPFALLLAQSKMYVFR